jgi:hypothetical protein
LGSVKVSARGPTGDSTFAKEGDVGGVAGRNAEVVRDEHHGDSVLVIEAGDGFQKTRGRR